MNSYMSITRRLFAVALLCVLTLVATSCAKPNLTGAAENIVDSMAKGDFKAATADFNPAMQSAMPAQKLSQVWAGLVAYTGPFKKRTGTRETEDVGYKTVYVTCQFEKMTLEAKIVFTSNKQVSGLWLAPVESAAGGK